MVFQIVQLPGKSLKIGLDLTDYFAKTYIQHLHKKALVTDLGETELGFLSKKFTGNSQLAFYQLSCSSRPWVMMMVASLCAGVVDRKQSVHFWKETLLLPFEYHEPSAILFYYTGEKADIFMADIFKTHQLAPKQFRWIKNSTGKICIFDLQVICPFNVKGS